MADNTKKLPIYEMVINEDPESDLQVDFIALVDKPAIKRDFVKFNDEFVEPSKGERKDNFVPRCITYVIGEGKKPDQAAAICNSIWDQHFAGNKVSFDYDDTLSTSRGKEMALNHIKNGDTVYIISARDNKEGMLSIAQELGIPESRVYATGSNEAKIQKVKDLGIDKHIDNNQDVVSALNGIGSKFKMNFAIQDEEKRIISGPLMVADQLIYRNDPDIGEYQVYFTKDTIRKIAIKLAQKGFQNNVNLMHREDMQIPGVTLFEVFQSDAERGIKPMRGFEDLADGSLFGSMYVDNDAAWEMVKQDKIKGFSVEGSFGMRKRDKYEEQFEQIVEILNLTNFN